MADAPSGGGSSWGPLEIIILLILVIGLLDRLTGQPIPGSSTPTTSSTPQVVAPNPNDPKCGLHVIQPYSLETMHGSVPVIGSVSGCNWPTINGTTALFAQVVDANGLPLSAYTTIPISTTDETGANFYTTILLTTPATTLTGYVIFIPAADPNQKHFTTRVEVKFAH